MSEVQIAALDLQFGDNYDSQKMKRLVDEVNSIVSGVNDLQSQISDIPQDTGVTEAELTAAIAGVTQQIDALSFADLAGVDPNTFKSPIQGDVIKFVNGYWSAVADAGGSTIPTAPGSGVLGWSAADNAYQWYALGHALAFSGSLLNVVESDLDHAELSNLSTGNPHPQYPLSAVAQTILGAWSFSQEVTASAGLISDAETFLYGDVLQAEVEPVQSIQDTDATAGEDIWTMRAEPGMLTFAAGDDNGSDDEEWLSITRIADVVDQINFQGNSLTFNGDDLWNGQWVRSNQAAAISALGLPPAGSVTLASNVLPLISMRM